MDCSRMFTTALTATLSDIACLCISRLFVDVDVPIVQEDLPVHYFVRYKTSQRKVAVHSVFMYDLSPPNNVYCLPLRHFVAIHTQ